MPVSVQNSSLLSVDEYLAREPHSTVRHEYIAGQVYAMTGASRAHGLIVTALAYALTPAVRCRKCQLFIADMKVRLEISGQTMFYYPDLLVSCDDNECAPYFCVAPCLIIEVLSSSTERIDRGEKLLAYQSIPSLREYMLVAQHQKQVDVYRRATGWQAESHDEGKIRLDCLGTVIDLADIYVDAALFME